MENGSTMQKKAKNMSVVKINKKKSHLIINLLSPMQDRSVSYARGSRSLMILHVNLLRPSDTYMSYKLSIIWTNAGI